MKGKEHKGNTKKLRERNTKEIQTNEGIGKQRKHKQMKAKEHEGNTKK